MRITLYLSTNEREQEIGRALYVGCKQHGVSVKLLYRSDFWQSNLDKQTDIIGFIGVKSRRFFNAALAEGKTTMIIDKGYFGRGEYYRISVGGYQPPYLHRMDNDPSRMVGLGVMLHPLYDGGQPGDHVMYVGSSEKYCLFHELGSCNDYARKIVTEIKKYWQGPIIYRPKPSWWAKPKPGEARDNLKDLGVYFSGPGEAAGAYFVKKLRQCKAIVTHGSNGAVEALARGVPTILTSPVGVSPVHHLCSHGINEITNPYWPPAEERMKTLSQLAWCQFSVKEMASGFAWENIKRWLP